MDALNEVFLDALVDDERRFAFLLQLSFLLGLLLLRLLLYGDVVFVSERYACRSEVAFLDLHDEGDGVSSLATSEAVASVACR